MRASRLPVTVFVSLAGLWVLSACAPNGGEASPAAPSLPTASSPTSSPSAPQQSQSAPNINSLSVEAFGDVLVLVQQEADGNALGLEGVIEVDGRCISVTIDSARYHAVFLAGTEIRDDGLVSPRGHFAPFGQTTVFSQFQTPEASSAPTEYQEVCGDDLPLFGVGL